MTITNKIKPEKDFPHKFYKSTIEVIAKRVNYICSNPNCRNYTTGPDTDEGKSNNLGEAAHIRAASPGGPRFLLTQTEKQRRAASNGIWLCSNCAKLIDSDERLYTVQLLEDWKKDAEAWAAKSIGKLSSDAKNDVMDFIRLCLSRPAFEDRFYQERSEREFTEAIQDTIAAFNTGRLFSRSGNLHAEIDFQKIERFRKNNEQLNSIYQKLKSILIAINNEKFDSRNRASGDNFCSSYKLADFIDSTRREIIHGFNALADSLDLPRINNYF